MGFFRDAYNLAFGKPIEYETLDSWSKVCDDVLKASIIGIPALIFMNLPPLNKLVCGFFWLSAYMPISLLVDLSEAS